MTTTRAIALLLVLLLTCCAAPPVVPASAVGPAPASATTATRGAPAPPRPDLAWFLDRAETVPLLDAARFAVAVAKGERLQADLLPNPRAGLYGERIETGDLSRGVQKRRASVWQRIETGGKREARVRVATAEIEDRSARVRLERSRIRGAVATAHQRALAAERLAGLHRRMAADSEALLELRTRQVRAGRESESVLLPLRVLAGQHRAMAAEAEAAHFGALGELEALLALTPGTLRGVSGSQLALRSLAPLGDVEEAPEVAVLAAAEEAARTGIASAEARAWPDVSVGASYESVPEFGGGRMRTVGVGVEADLPLFDRNQGGIAAAWAETRRAQALLRDGRTRIPAEHEMLKRRAASLDLALRALRGEVIPALEREDALAEAEARGGRTDRAPALAARVALGAARADATETALEIAVLVVRANALVGRLEAR